MATEKINFLLSGDSEVSQEAERVLTEAGIPFNWVPSEDRNYNPTLIAHRCAKSFQGLRAIKDFAGALD